jgi:hypothetical protein
MPGTYFLVDPQSRTSWEHDWTPFLGENETIDSRLWTIAPMNPGSPETPVLSNETSNVVFVEGLLPGQVYHLRESAVMNTGVRTDQTIVLRAQDT